MIHTFIELIFIDCLVYGRFRFWGYSSELDKVLAFKEFTIPVDIWTVNKLLSSNILGNNKCLGNKKK